MKKAYKYKLRLNNKTKTALAGWFGCSRWVYNWAFDYKIKAYKEENLTISCFDLCKTLTQVKRQEQTSWLNEVPATLLQQSIRDLDSAYKRFFNRGNGFPKFKSKHRSRKSVRIVDKVKVDFSSGRIFLPKIGYVRFFTDPRTPQGKASSFTVSQDSTGSFWVSVLLDEPKAKTKPHPKEVVGLDLGIKSFLVTSDGLTVPNPRFLELGLKRIKHEQRVLSRRTRGSGRYRRQRIKVATLHQRVKNKRANFLHHISKELTTRYSTICVENLNVSGMLSNHHLAQSISNASWSEFIRQLTYKTEWRGGNLLQIGRFEPSSKRCNSCGYINQDLKLKDRHWVCPVCDSELERDLNAAKNIKDIAVGDTVNGRGATALAGRRNVKTPLTAFGSGK